MAKFQTTDGHEWTLALTIGTVLDLKADGFDLGAAMKTGDGLALALFGDPEEFAALLWKLVKTEAEARKVDQSAFYRALDPPALDQAGDAFMGAVVDFYHRRRAPAIREKLPALLKTVDERATGEVTRLLDEALKKSAGGSPDSSASIPDG